MLKRKFCKKITFKREKKKFTNRIRSKQKMTLKSTKFNNYNYILKFLYFPKYTKDQ